jgi:hypothetical protein
MATRGEKCRSFDAISSPDQWVFLSPEMLYFLSRATVRLGVRNNGLLSVLNKQLAVVYHVLLTF